MNKKGKKRRKVKIAPFRNFIQTLHFRQSGTPQFFQIINAALFMLH